jgi:predicted ATP-grasp superfamily ATP-dependent carboligase
LNDFIVVGSSRAIVLAMLQTIRSFSDAGCLVLGDARTEALSRSRLCTRHLPVRFDGDDDGFVAVVRRLARESPGAILIPTDCDAIRLVNRVRARLAVRITPAPDTETLDTFDDKWLFSRFCERHGLSAPSTRLVGTKRNLDFDTLAAEFGLPFVVKPVNQSGSQGVEIVSSREHFRQRIAGNDAYQFYPLIVQRYIDGCDIDLSLLALEGRLRAFAIQQAAGAEIRFVPNAYLEHVAEKICGLANYHGLMHIDARVERSTGRIYLIESNPRFWVSMTASAWCGVNFFAECLQPAAQAGPVRRLTGGIAQTRHPLLRPACWPLLLSDGGVRGRLLRATLFDRYTFGKLVGDVPAMFERLRKRLDHAGAAGKAAA